MEVLTVFFKSDLPFADVQELFHKRASRFRAVRGLLQKLYVHDEVSGQAGGIYVFDSKEHLEQFLKSDLANSISGAYRSVDPPVTRILHVAHVLYEEKLPVP